MKNKNLGGHFCSVHKLDPDKVLAVEYIDPSSLVRPARLDLISKIKYAEAYIQGALTDQAIYEYKEFIKGFSLNKFTEGDGSKQNFLDFKNSFEKLIESIKKNGFDPQHAVPVGEDDTVIGGAHRTAIMVALGQRMPVVRIKGLVANYNAEFFKQRDVPEEVIETSLTRLAGYINATAFVLWPNLNKKQKKIALELIRRRASVIYQRDDVFNFQGMHALVAMTYFGSTWIGSPLDRYAGAVNKANQINGASNSSVTTLFVEIDCYQGLQLKQNIRNILNCGNNGVHCTDSRQETVYILNVLLNRNTRHLLTNGNPFKYKKYIYAVMQYREKIINNHLPIDEFCIVSSGVLGLYGLRVPNDIDFLTLSEVYDLIIDKNTESHHHLLKNGIEKHELMNHSVHYISFFDIKVISLEHFILMNNCREEKTKKNDIVQVNKLLNDDAKSLVIYRFKLKVYQALRRVMPSRCRVFSVLFAMKNSALFSALYYRLKKSKLGNFIIKKIYSFIYKMPVW